MREPGLKVVRPHVDRSPAMFSVFRPLRLPLGTLLLARPNGALACPRADASVS